MNVFKVLSSYDGNINEPSISAFLAYLLNPKEDHGIGYLFLNEIVEIFKDNEQKVSDYLKNYEITIRPEFTVDVPSSSSDKTSRDIDILIEFYNDQDKEIPVFSICIENKIFDESFTDMSQISDEIVGLKHEYEGIEKECPTIYFLLICPKETPKIKESFSKEETIQKRCLLWNESDNTNSDIIVGTVMEKLQNVLKKEETGLVDPFSTEIKYLIKAFMSFASNGFKSESVTDKNERQKYGRTVMEYLIDVQKNLKEDEEYTKDYIQNMLAETIKKETKKELNSTTKYKQVRMCIVNEPARVDRTIKNPSEGESKNLFYYPKNQKGNIVKKFTFDITEDIDIYWGKYGEKPKIYKLSNIKKT